MAFRTLFSKVKEKKGKITELRSQEIVGKDKEERSKTGFEAEFFVIDNEGRISNEADKIIKKAEKEKNQLDVKKECTTSFVEIGVLPRIYVRNVAVRFLDDMSQVLDIAEKMDLGFYPMAIYPGKYEPVMRQEGWYSIKQKIFGKDKWRLAGRCAGFHFHYNLPSGIFTEKGMHLVENPKRKEKQRALNAYNFAIAADPALTTFTQSSPIFNGRYLAKDSRMLLYRSGKELQYDGLYSKLSKFGGLPPYTITYEDFIDEIDERYEGWKDIMSKAGVSNEEIEDYSKLYFAWNPVRINKMGTIEKRGMDMNLPSNLMAVGILIKYALKNIIKSDLEVIPSTVGIKNPFLFEENKVYVPPFWYLNSHLQRYSARSGLDSDIVYRYCKNFFSFCMRSVNKKYYPAIKPVKDILKDRMTRSDEILAIVRKKYYRDQKEIPDEVLREIVLSYSKKLRKDIEETKEIMVSLEEGKRA